MKVAASRLGTKIQEYRQINHLTQEQLASRLGICSRSVIALEKGNANPRMDSIKKIVQCTNISPDYLFIDHFQQDSVFLKSILEELDGCSEAELKFLYPVIRQLLASLSAYS